MVPFEQGSCDISKVTGGRGAERGSEGWLAAGGAVDLQAMRRMGRQIIQDGRISVPFLNASSRLCPHNVSNKPPPASVASRRAACLLRAHHSQSPVTAMAPINIDQQSASKLGICSRCTRREPRNLKNEMTMAAIGRMYKAKYGIAK